MNYIQNKTVMSSAVLLTVFKTFIFADSAPAIRRIRVGAYQQWQVVVILPAVNFYIDDRRAVQRFTPRPGKVRADICTQAVMA